MINVGVFTVVMLLVAAMLIVVFGEGLMLSRGVKKLAAERHPDEDTKGVGLYAAMRAMQIRRLRMPGPQVKIGEKDKV